MRLTWETATREGTFVKAKWLLTMLAPALLTLGLVSACGAERGGNDGVTLPNGMTMQVEWSVKGDTGTIKLTVDPKAVQLKRGQCVDGIFDWKVDYTGPKTNHHDPRILRVCQGGKPQEHTFTDRSGGFEGMNKIVLCYGPLPKPNVKAANCIGRPGPGAPVLTPQALEAIPTNLPNDCAGAYVVLAQGGTRTYEGGREDDCEN